MKLYSMTWEEVSKVNRDCVVLIPTGSLEQHGPHLPLFTDTLLATKVAEEVEAKLSEKVLLVPSLWLGASTHHLGFAGSLSNSFAGYGDALKQVVLSLHRHGFWKFFVVNGHGGNTSSNDIALRELLAENPELLLGHAGYFSFISDVASHMEGPAKSIQHACEAETSLMLAAHPELVRMDKAVDDGLKSPVPGMVHFFDTVTERGALGYPTLATADKGEALLDQAISGLAAAIETLYSGYQLTAD